MKKAFPHIFVIFSFLLLVYLGTWQLQRRTEKQNMLAEIDAHINAQPLKISEYTNIKDDEYRKMSLTGKYLFDKEFLLLNKPFNGKAGQHVITPIQTADGQVILVDRGWISTDKEYEKPQGEVTILSIVRAGQKLNSMAKLITLENNPSKQTWFWLDLPTIYKSLNLPQKDYYLDLIDPSRDKARCVADDSAISLGNSPTNPAIHNGCDYKSTSYPIALSSKIEVYNEHLIYVITWYSLSIVLLLVYYFRFWKK